MKTLVKIVLNILFVIVFLFFSISLILKFQILDANFWKKTFTANGTYLAISVAIKDNLVSQVVAGGGSKNDATPLTNLVTPDILKDFIENNVDNLLGFINGKNKEIIVYIPIEKIPKTLLAGGTNGISEYMPLSELLTEFNVQGISASQIEQIKVIGIVTNYVFVISGVIVVLILFALNFSGLTILLGGISIGAGALVIVFFRNAVVHGLAGEQNLVAMILKIVSPPVLQQVIKFWTCESLVIILIGIVVTVVKKMI